MDGIYSSDIEDITKALGLMLEAPRDEVESYMGLVAPKKERSKEK